MNKDICVYCGDYKEVKIWEWTGELVCYDCRLDYLDQEFREEENPVIKTVGKICDLLKDGKSNR